MDQQNPPHPILKINSGSRFFEELDTTPPGSGGGIDELERSKFSPDSDPPSPQRSWLSPLASKAARSTHEDVESLSKQQRRTVLERFGSLIFRNSGVYSNRPLPPTPSVVNSEKVQYPPATRPTSGRVPPQTKQKKRRSRWCVFVLILIILALLGNVVFLDVRVVELTKVTDKNTPSSPAPTSNSSNPTSEAVGECLSQFTIDAPSNPSAYPCSTCLSILSNLTSNNSDAANAVQFCGLRAILESTSTTGQTALSNGGWGKDLRVCTWSGVSCSNSSLVTSLQLTFPAVPALIPREISAFSQLQSLQVVGDGNYPAGAVPDSFRNLTSLTTLHLESTAITTLPSDLFSLLTKVTDLTLIANRQFAGNLTSVINLPLQSLILRNQELGNPIDSFAESQHLQSSLLVLDLSSNSLSGSIPASISSLAALTQLHLDNNNLGQAVPGAFPRSLQSLTISNNTNLSGTMPSDLCSSTTLKECDLRGTSVNRTNGCGICQF